MRGHFKASSAGSTFGVGKSHGQTLALLVAIVSVALLVLGGGVARAEVTYLPNGMLGKFALGEFPEKTTAVAIEESSGYVLVVRSTPGRVVVFESDQNEAAALTTFGEGELSSPTGIAINQADGSIYISDAGNNRIVRYTSDGATPPVYTRDASYVSPTHGTDSEEVGDFAAQLAIDPATGDLLVADPGNKRIERFASTGAFIDSFDGSDSPDGAFTSLLDLTAAPDGTIYVVADGVIGELGEVTGSRVEQFAADGTFAGPLPDLLPSSRTVAFDSRTQSLLVGMFGGFAAPPARKTLAVVRDGVETQQFGYGEFFEDVEDLASPQAGDGNVVSLTGPTPFGPFAYVELITFVNLEPSIDPPTSVDGTSAHLSGSVDPNGATEVTAHFEFRVVGQSTWTSTEDQAVPASDSPEPVEANLNNLLPAEEYEVRLVATRPGVTTPSTAIKFETGIVVPVAETLGVTGITASSATLNGSVTAEGIATTYFFEYGPTSAYGSKVPAGEAAAGVGRAPRRFSSTLTGLSAGATYHFRIVAKNAAGTAFGADVEFMTPTAPPPGRAYEQVTPVDQRGGNINGALGVEALPGADGISYITTPVGEGAESAPKEARAMSFRGTSDWGPQIHIDPPFNARTGLNFALTAAVSDDGTHALVVSNRALAPGGVEARDVMNIYVKDLRDGSYVWVGTAKGEEPARELIQDSRHMVIRGSPSFDWIVFWSAAQLLPGVPKGGTSDGLGTLYRWSSAGLEVESLAPDPVLVQRYRNEQFAMRQVSDDGSRIFFQAASGVYLREAGQTKAVSVSELDETLHPGELYACSRTGRFVFFRSGRLTGDAPEGEDSLYRYDTETEDLEFIAGAVFVDFSRVLGVSEDGSTIYWIPGFGGQTLMWRDGNLVTLPAPIEGPTAGISGDLQISPNGIYAGIQSNRDVYLWNAETEELTCASCEAGTPTGSALVPTSISAGFEKNGVYRVPQWVGDDGSVFFTTEANLQPDDVNGVGDAYEFIDDQQRLISPGDGPYAALFMDISKDGKDVYFLTNQPLVPRDTNRSSDIYDARRGGGFPTQQQVPAPPCVGESCQAAVNPPPAAASVGSESVTPASRAKKRANCKGKRKGARPKGACHRHKHRKAHGKRSSHRRNGR